MSYTTRNHYEGFLEPTTVYINKRTSASFNKEEGFYLWSLENGPYQIHIETINTKSIIDFICGNKWPEDMEEFFSLVIQEINQTRL